ncbi:tripartite motif-containing protein 45-like [Patiria miniata]|uniref:Uncharacterized protein n=1 Tax=Patiria miniata TaxID=46514 RepID=A0A913Z9A4_PATMI|nr:tripartite motif-containing protein 45-like [Patiria miniata]
MAEGGVTDLVLDETQKELQECPICCTEYKDPRMLDCSHNFCLKCLQELKRTQNKDDKNIVCPLCRRETALTEAGVDMLPGGSKNQQEQTEGQGLKVTCQACDEENEAISRCMDCKHYLCQECLKAHNRLASLRAHKIVDLTELPVESEEITEDTELKKVPKCFKHPDQDLCLYCNSCEVLICRKCTNSDHKESMHSHISIDQAVSRCKQEVHESVSKTEEYIKEFISANPVSVDQIRYRLDKMLAKTDSQITLKAEKEIAKIREKEKQLKKEARDIVIKRDREFACAATPQQTVSKVNAVMTTATCYEILESKKQMLRDLNEQVEVHKSLDIKHGKSFLGFKESEEIGQLGTLLLEEKWERDETFLPTIYNPKDLAAYSTSELVMAHYNELRTLDPEGKVISTKTYKPYHKPNEPHDPNDIQKPTALAINKDDQLLILDNPAVKIFTKEYQLLHQFLPGKEAGVDATPMCLAVDSSNLIAVGYKDKEQISLHNPDGSLIRTLPAPKIDRHLTISNKRLIYTNGNGDLLMAVDLHGNKLFTQSCSDPRGLCCDDAGDIYLCATPGIWHFSADGKRIVSMHDGNPCFPHASTCKYTTAHELVVTEPVNGLMKIFRYHLV